MATNQQQSILISKTLDDLCNWELINQSDYSNDVDDDVNSDFGVQSFDLSDLDLDLDLDEHDEQEEEEDIDLDLDDDQEETESESESDLDLDDEQEEEKDADLDLDLDLVNNDMNMDRQENYDRFEVGLVNYVVNDDEEEYDDDEEDDDDDDGDDYMDDELVPWELKGLYMRERIKKSGKKSMMKMDKSTKFFRSVRGRYGSVKAF